MHLPVSLKLVAKLCEVGISGPGASLTEALGVAKFPARFAADLPVGSRSGRGSAW